MSRAAASPTPPSDDAFRALWLAAQSVWPSFGLSLERFALYLSRHAQDGPLPAPERAGDVYLACACAERVPAAIGAFEQVLAAAVGRAVARIDSSRGFVDLVSQDLRTRLLMGDPPKITDYAGRAPFASWLKTAAVRAALNLRRARGDQAHDSLPAGLVAMNAPDIELIRAKYRTEFQDALRSALAALPERERTLLALSVGEGMSIDQLAEKYAVGRSTAARWLVAARDLLQRETRRVLMDRLGLTPSELDSVAAEVRSEVDVSIVRLLARA
jgi:RNA polymerase sigma-70 factor (ECF subfamily)